MQQIVIEFKALYLMLKKIAPSLLELSELKLKPNIELYIAINSMEKIGSKDGEKQYEVT